MPSTLYESVKNSVIEYAQIKKRNERKEDKLLFKWKLITLVLAILLIVLIGVFSQLLQTINNLPTVTSDKSYVMPLLGQVQTQSVQTLAQANNLISGITKSSDLQQAYFEWNDATRLYISQGSLSLPDLIKSIDGQEELLFIFSYENIDSTTARFGLRAHKGYNQVSLKDGVVTVQDDSQTRYSSIFNINSGQALSYDVGQCSLFIKTDTSLTIFQSIVFTEVAGSTQLEFNILKYPCFSTSSPQQAMSQLGKVTGMDTTLVTNFTRFSLEVYTLSLTEQAQYEM